MHDSCAFSNVLHPWIRLALFPNAFIPSGQINANENDSLPKKDQHTVDLENTLNKLG